LGRIVSKLCNRKLQVSDFNGFFITNLGSNFGLPQFYFIPGKKLEGHDSLIERLKERQIKPAAENRWGKQAGAVFFKEISWPYEINLKDRQDELIGMLFTEIDPNYSKMDRSASALSNLPILSPYKLIVIRHKIRAAGWDGPTKKLIEWYRKYWSELE